MLSRLVLVLTLLNAPWPAHASPPPTDDVIVTTDGAILRGHVSELRPGKSATIVLLDGRTRTLQWGEIAKSEGPSFPREHAARETKEEEPLDLMQPGPGRAALTVESAGKQQRIRLHVDSGVRINGFGYSVSAEVCRTPCRVYLPPATYGIESVGEGVTSAFTIVDVGPGGAHVKLKAASSRVHGAGLALVLVGSLTAAAGGIVMAVAPLTSSVSSALGEPSSQDNMLLGGGITLGAGLAMLIPGAVMMGVSKGGAVEKDSFERAPVDKTLQVNAGPTRGGGWVGASVRF
ncbi:MAG: hypothetical protein ACXVCV_13415 [Polyangia bacterium]